MTGLFLSRRLDNTSVLWKRFGHSKFKDHYTDCVLNHLPTSPVLVVTDSFQVQLFQCTSTTSSKLPKIKKASFKESIPVYPEYTWAIHKDVKEPLTLDLGHSKLPVLRSILLIILELINYWTITPPQFDPNIATEIKLPFQHSDLITHFKSSFNGLDQGCPHFYRCRRKGSLMERACSSPRFVEVMAMRKV